MKSDDLIIVRRCWWNTSGGNGDGGNANSGSGVVGVVVEVGW